MNPQRGVQREEVASSAEIRSSLSCLSEGPLWRTQQIHAAPAANFRFTAVDAGRFEHRPALFIASPQPPFASLRRALRYAFLLLIDILSRGFVCPVNIRFIDASAMSAVFVFDFPSLLSSQATVEALSAATGARQQRPAITGSVALAAVRVGKKDHSNHPFLRVHLRLSCGWPVNSRPP